MVTILTTQNLRGKRTISYVGPSKGLRVDLSRKLLPRTWKSTIENDRNYAKHLQMKSRNIFSKNVLSDLQAFTLFMNRKKPKYSTQALLFFNITKKFFAQSIFKQKFRRSLPMNLVILALKMIRPCHQTTSANSIISQVMVTSGYKNLSCSIML